MLRSVYTQLFPPKPSFTEGNVEDQSGRVFIVTGGNGGIGYELCKKLYGTGATIYMATRSKDRAQKAIIDIMSAQPAHKNTGAIKFLSLDLNDLKSVKAAAAEFAAQESKLDVLWNNAGPGPNTIGAGAKTSQGLEPLIGIHCVAALMFTQLLLPQLRAAVQDPSRSKGSVRVIWTSSIAVDSSPPNGLDLDLLSIGTEDRVRNYATSKVGNWMLSREMARRYGSEGIVSVAINPGNVKAGSWAGSSAGIMIFHKLTGHETYLAAYTGLYAGLSQDISVEKNGAYVIPWGRIRPDENCARKDIIHAMTPESEGGLGYCQKFWDWCEGQWKPYA